MVQEADAGPRLITVEIVRVYHSICILMISCVHGRDEVVV